MGPQKGFKVWWRHNFYRYCGIIIVCGRPMFVAFKGYPCPRIFIPTNEYTSICLIFIYKISLATHKITSPRTRKVLATHKHWPPQISMIPQYSMIICFRYRRLCFPLESAPSDVDVDSFIDVYKVTHTLQSVNITK